MSLCMVWQQNRRNFAQKWLSWRGRGVYSRGGRLFRLVLFYISGCKINFLIFLNTFGVCLNLFIVPCLFSIIAIKSSYANSYPINSCIFVLWMCLFCNIIRWILHCNIRHIFNIFLSMNINITLIINNFFTQTFYSLQGGSKKTYPFL